MVIALVRAFPLDTGVRLSAGAWRKLAPHGRRHQRALENLKRAFPDKSDAEREKIAIDMWANLGRVMAETMQLDRILAQPERITIKNEQMLRRYYGKMGSAICVSLHTGNWELAMWPLAAAGMSPAAVYRLVKNPYVDLYLRSQRKALYPAGLFAKGKSAGKTAGLETARMLGSYVRQGGRLGFLTDLYDKTGIEVPFFGHNAKSTPFPAMIARRLGARMWVGRCVRIGEQSNFEVEIRELKVPRTDSTSDDVKTITADIQAQFESWIREHPEQWMWSNRRWK